ncbi:hypothetical protein B0H11DRAFT_1927671 [Mycena galericulata]|nr:hypothetical protein B0H11DRAFT_1927671 [Mycena galericulata]
MLPLTCLKFTALKMTTTREVLKRDPVELQYYPESYPDFSSREKAEFYLHARKEKSASTRNTSCRDDRDLAPRVPHFATFTSSPAEIIMNAALEMRPMSETDRLINALRDGLAELGRKNDENTDRPMRPRLQKALDSIRPKPVVTDKETAFWTAYQTLADESDKEFHQKYSSDLDNSLIFAGLFSAVESAFLIQMQPNLQPNTENTGPGMLVIAAQILLYISLFTTLSAAMLAALGKQWLLHYGEAGNRGTLEQRGLERQRKLDGLMKWKFEFIVQVFPLLLQLALLLFWVALALYLWTIYCPLAITVISLTSIGSIAYVALLISAARYPDSPFQTPLSGILLVLLTQFSQSTIKKLISRIYRKAKSRVSSWFSPKATGSGWSLQKKLHTLPLFHNNTSGPEPKRIPPPPGAIFDGTTFPAPSPTVPAVLWLLETSTNPLFISAAAGVAADLQWPLGLELDAVLARLRAIYIACFDVVDHNMLKVRDDSVQRAINCGQAYAILQIVSAGDPEPLHYSDSAPMPYYNLLSPSEAEASQSLQLADLRNVFDLLQGSVSFTRNHTKSSLSWTLSVLPHRFNFNNSILNSSIISRLSYLLEEFPAEKLEGLTLQDYANYLFCMNTFLGYQPSLSDIARRDKR